MELNDTINQNKTTGNQETYETKLKHNETKHNCDSEQLGSFTVN